jgi:hypothetical protein
VNEEEQVEVPLDEVINMLISFADTMMDITHDIVVAIGNPELYDSVGAKLAAYAATEERDLE